MGNIKITLKVLNKLKREMRKYPKADWNFVVMKSIKERLELLR